jgi:hypothetical protein
MIAPGRLRPLRFPRFTFPKLHCRFSQFARCPAIRLRENEAGESAMRILFLIAIMAFGITTAEAQTASTAGTGSDPLGVPVQALPTGSAPAGGTAGSASSAGSTGNSAAGGSTSAITTSPSNTSQVPLQLSGERSGTSTQAATSTAGAASHAASSSVVCPPPVPTSDGGSANITEMVGGSLDGC